MAKLPPARARRRGAAPKRRSWGQRTLIGCGSLGVLALLIVASGLGWVNWRAGQLRHYNISLPEGNGPQNFLIAGSDSRAKISRSSPNAGAFLDGEYQSGQRSDSIMILRVDPKSATASLLSIPRDLWVPIWGTSYSAKINSAFSIGPKTLVNTIRQNFGIEINHFIDIDFKGFQKLIETIGGVPIYFATGMRDDNTGLDVEHAGCVTLNGTQALGFARSRHLVYYDRDQGEWVSDDANDFGRIKRQQFLIRQVVHKIEKGGVLRNPVKVNDLAGVVLKTVGVDKKLSLSDLLALANRYRSFDAQHLVTYTIPSTRYFADGQDALQVDDTLAKPILDKFRSGDAPTTLAERSVKVSVYNGTAVAGQAADVAGALGRVGFKVRRTGNASDLGLPSPDHSEVIYSDDGDQAAAELVASHITDGATVIQQSGMPDGTVYLVTGADFSTVSAKAAPTTSTTTGSQQVSAAGANGTDSGSGSGSSAGAVTTSTEAGAVPPANPPAGVSCG